MIIDGGLPTVFVSDLDRSVKFFTEVLELKLRERSGNLWALREALQTLTLLLAPMMPHLAEEAWAALGQKQLVVETPWPVADAELARENTITIAVQFNGKRRAELEIAPGTAAAELEARALALEPIKRALDGKPARKVIVVPDRIVNVVG